MSMAPKNANGARATTVSSAEGANAASAKIAAKPVEPMSSNLRRPMRSPIAPMGTSRAESTRVRVNDPQLLPRRAQRLSDCGHREASTVLSMGPGAPGT